MRARYSAAPGLGEHLLSKPRLAHSRLSPQHDQPAVAFGGVVEAVDQLGALFFPAHKGGTLGQVMGTGFLLGGRGPGDLEELPAIVKALEPKPATVDELGFGNFARELFDDASDQDLVALGPGCHPRRGVDGRAEEVTVLLTDLTAVQPDPAMDLAVGVFVVVLVDRLLDRHRAGDRLAGRRESDHEPVTKRLDLPPGVGLDLVANKVALSAQDRAGGLVPALVAHLGRALDVGQEDCERPLEHLFGRSCRQIPTLER